MDLKKGVIFFVFFWFLVKISIREECLKLRIGNVLYMWVKKLDEFFLCDEMLEFDEFIGFLIFEEFVEVKSLEVNFLKRELLKVKEKENIF